jgi:predicted phage terminase large subunit-like protein
MNSFRTLLQNDFFTFLKNAHREVNGSKLDNDPYLRLLADDVQGIADGTIRRYLCNLPPGHAKTFVFSISLPAWILAHNPFAKILILSYGEDLAIPIARAIRNILASDWFQDAFPGTQLAKDHRAAGDFGTRKGGRVFASSIDGAITGQRCDYLIIDDPVQISDANNLTWLDKNNSRFDTDVISRLNSPRTGSVVIVQHRLNRDDLTGHLLKRGGWTHRVVPLVATKPETYHLRDGTVWRRPEGVPLRPNAYTENVIADLREHTGAPGFGPLYQQTFEGPDVLQIVREDLIVEPVYKTPNAPFIISADLNQKGEAGTSFSVIQCWALMSDGRHLLADQWRGRATRKMLGKQFRTLSARYNPSVILIEDNGPASELAETLHRIGYNVELITPRGDKFSRLRAHVQLFRDHRIVLPAGSPFIADFISEFIAFPHGENSDQVDAATQMFRWIENNDLPAPKRRGKAHAICVIQPPIGRKQSFPRIGGRPNIFVRRRR